MVNFLAQIKIFIKASGKIIKKMEKVYLHGQINDNMMENGKKKK